MAGIDLGAVSAYAVAVEHGFDGTEAEWEAYIANASINGQRAVAAAEQAAASATRAETAAAEASAAYGTDLLAVTFNQATSYTAGQHVIYSGKYYVLPNGHDANVTWANTTKTEERVGDEISDLKSAINNHALTDEIKIALLACFEKIAWSTPEGQDTYDALEAALNPPADLTSISAVYTQPGTVYTDDPISTLRVGLVVTAHYSNGTASRIYGYVLSGLLVEGTSTVTVMYGGKTTTFNVTVTDNTLIYSLSSPVTFNGATENIINTGVDLFPTDRDLTIIMEITGPTAHNNDWVFWYGTTSSPYTGLNMQYQNGSYALCSPKNGAAYRANCASYRDSVATRYVIRKHSGDNPEIYCYNAEGGESSGQTTSSSVVAPSSTLMLGGVGTVSFGEYNYKGIISDFKVYSRYFSDEEKAAYLEV